MHRYSGGGTPGTGGTLSICHMAAHFTVKSACCSSLSFAIDDVYADILPGFTAAHALGRLQLITNVKRFRFQNSFSPWRHAAQTGRAWADECIEISLRVGDEGFVIFRVTPCSHSLMPKVLRDTTTFSAGTLLTVLRRRTDSRRCVQVCWGETSEFQHVRVIRLSPCRGWPCLSAQNAVPLLLRFSFSECPDRHPLKGDQPWWQCCVCEQRVFFSKRRVRGAYWSPPPETMLGTSLSSLRRGEIAPSQ